MVRCREKKKNRSTYGRGVLAVLEISLKSFGTKDVEEGHRVTS
jgi:hypothetical protein